MMGVFFIFYKKKKKDAERGVFLNCEVYSHWTKLLKNIYLRNYLVFREIKFKWIFIYLQRDLLSNIMVSTILKKILLLVLSNYSNNEMPRRSNFANNLTSN